MPVDFCCPDPAAQQKGAMDPYDENQIRNPYGEEVLSDEDESTEAPPPPPDTVHPDDMQGGETGTRTSEPPSGEKFSDEYSSEYQNYDGNYDVESKGTGDPPEEVQKPVIEFDEDFDYEEDQSVEIPPTQVVNRMVNKENRDKNNRRNMVLIAAVCCCIIIGFIILAAGFGSGRFSEEEKSAATAGGGTSAGGDTSGDSPTQAPGPSPTIVNVPTNSDQEEQRTAQVTSFLQSISLDADGFNDQNSVQTQASNFLSSEDNTPFDSENAVDQFRMKQKFALLAGLWYPSWDYWFEEGNWADDQDECTWFGIVCEEVDIGGGEVAMAVTEIDLRENNLQGLSEEIGLLEHVRILTLNGNIIADPVPASIVQMTKLEELYLYENFMTGDWPEDLSTLAAMKIFRIADNAFTGPVERFYSMRALEMLVVDDNMFDGSLEGVSALSNLQRLTMGNNEIDSEIPVELSTLSKLEILWLFKNNFFGIIPDEIATMPELVVFDVFDNALGGGLPTKFVDSPKLEVLSLSSNPFGGEIPDEYGSLQVYSLSIEDCDLTGAINPLLANAPNIMTLRIGSNDFDNNLFPAEILGMTNLVDLRMDGCNIRGRIPDGIDQLEFLQTLHLQDNNMRFELPTTIGNLQFLTSLDLSNNFFEGAVPDEFNNLANLVEINLSRNGQLIGDLPLISGMSKLERLEIQATQLGSVLTADSTYFTSVPTLKYIDVSVTTTSGAIPDNWDAMVNLEELKMTNLGLTGGVPASLGQVPTLKVVILASNALSSEIPDFFGSLPELQVFNVDRNQLFGEIPASIGQATKLQYLRVNGQRVADNPQTGLSGELPASLGDLVNLKMFQCQENNIGGQLPPELGNLANLEILNIGSNAFSGNIPIALKNLESLIEFILDDNNFNDFWPPAICDIDTVSLIRPDCNVNCAADCCNRDFCN